MAEDSEPRGLGFNFTNEAIIFLAQYIWIKAVNKGAMESSSHLGIVVCGVIPQWTFYHGWLIKSSFIT